MASQNSRRLPIWQTLIDALSAAATNWEVLLKAIALPTLVVAGVNVAMSQGEQPQFTRFLPFMVVSGLAGVLIAVSCHRLVILGADALPSRWGLFWTMRETRFVGWTIAVMLVSILTILPVILIGLIVAGAVARSGDLASGSSLFPIVGVLGMLVTFPVAFYVSSRLTLVLPATAIGERPTLKQSWRLSRSNGWRLVLLRFLPMLVMTPLSLLGRWWPGIVLQFLSAFSLALMGVIGIATLSKAYAWFTAEAATDTDSREA